MSAVSATKISKNNELKIYRTRNQAGPVDEVPCMIPAITNKEYRNAMSLNEDNTAYLQPFSDVDNLVYSNGQLLFQGLPATAATLKRYYTSEGVDNFDLPILRIFYAIILNRFANTWNEDQTVEEVVTIYYPDLAKKIGKASNISSGDVQACISNIMRFQNIMGVIEKGKRGNDILPVLVFMGYEAETNTIRLIKDIYKASMRRDRLGKTMLKKDGGPQMLPSHSYLIKLEIAKERNKKAVEIVFAFVALIERCGDHKPHITAETLIERNSLLYKSINECKSMVAGATQMKLDLTSLCNKTYGYARVSTPQQSIDRQIRNITAAYPDAVIIQEKWTGTTMARPAWEKLCKKLIPGDTIVFDSVSRMSRDAEEGFQVYSMLFQKEVNLVFLKEPHVNTETFRKAMKTVIPMTGTAVDLILKGINDYLLELAREQIQIAFEQSEKEVQDLHQRTKEGIETARANGKQIGQKKGSTLNVKKKDPAKEIILKHSKSFGGSLSDADCMKLAGISRATYYKYKHELRNYS